MSSLRMLAWAMPAGIAILAGSLALGVPAAAVPTAVHGAKKPELITHFCWGSDIDPEGYAKRNQPPAIVLECDAYSPQHGFTNTNWITNIEWDSFGGPIASGAGNLQHMYCTDGGQLNGIPICRGAVGSIPAWITLSGAQRVGKRYVRYTTVTVEVMGLPEAPEKGPQVLTWKPPADAYE